MINEFSYPSEVEKKERHAASVAERLVSPSLTLAPADIAGNYILDTIFHTDRSPMLIIMLRECCLINQSCLL